MDRDFQPFSPFRYNLLKMLVKPIKFSCNKETQLQLFCWTTMWKCYSAAATS